MTKNGKEINKYLGEVMIELYYQHKDPGLDERGE